MRVEYDESMLLWHPEMVLVSENPVTWHGFLRICCQTNATKNTRVKLKLTVPNYPSLADAQLHFGGRVTCFNNKHFQQAVRNLMQNSTTISMFLRHVQSLIGNYIEDNDDQKKEVSIGNESTIGILQELNDVFNVPSDVKLLSDDNLQTIKLSLKNISLKLQRTDSPTSPWKVISSDLPEIAAFAPFETNLITLNAARAKFKLQVEMLEKSWKHLEEIDEHCCVIDPIDPRPYHLYRRIYLSPSLSMLIKIDPLNPADLPEIKFLGSETEVEIQRENASANIHKWNPNCSVLENLTMLLSINEFPKKQVEDRKNINSILVCDEECCICYSLELNGQNLPDKVCNNEKCMRNFHSSCLLQWLQTVAGNHIAFNQIHGACPNCEESISCPINL